MSETILVDRDKAVVTLTLNRPEAYNALNLEIVDAFAEELTMLAVDESVRAVVVTGSGKAFCAGGDLKWASGFAEEASTSFHVLAARLHLAIIEIRRMYKPVIAAINGVAAGAGFSLALACDFRVMAKSAILRQAYTSNGLCIDGGGTFTLPRLVGMAKAMEIAAFDDVISADQAKAWGLATKVVDDGEALAEGQAMASVLAQRALHAFGATKELMTDSFSTSLETHLEHERKYLEECAKHADGKEGVRAFIEKRKPVYFAE